MAQDNRERQLHHLQERLLPASHTNGQQLRRQRMDESPGHPAGDRHQPRRGVVADCRRLLPVARDNAQPSLRGEVRTAHHGSEPSAELGDTRIFRSELRQGIHRPARQHRPIHEPTGHRQRNREDRHQRNHRHGRKAFHHRVLQEGQLGSRQRGLRPREDWPDADMDVHGYRLRQQRKAHGLLCPDTHQRPKGAGRHHHRQGEPTQPDEVQKQPADGRME